MSFEIEQRFKALDELITAASNKTLDEQTASYICRLGSVQICGNLERCIELLITSRFDRAPPQLRRFIRRHFERGTNYDCDRICQLLYHFDTTWGQNFETYITDNDAIKESISSCYAVRNSVAHGGSQSLGRKILRQYFEASLSVIAELEKSIR